MWKILQLEKPGNFVIGTGETHSVKEFVEEAFSYVDLRYEEYVRIDPRYLRPTETELLSADARKAEKELSWKPEIRFKDLVKIMIDADVRKMNLEPPGDGDKTLIQRFPKRWWKVD